MPLLGEWKDSFRGLPQPDPLLDEAYFAAGDFRTDGDEPLNGSKAFQELLENFGLEEHVEVLTLVLRWSS